MEAQDATTEYLFKLWPWIEANARRIAFGVAIVVLAVFVMTFYNYQHNKREVDAGEALTQAGINYTGGQLADAYLKVATDYSGTAAGQRALLQGATALFATDRFTDAQAQFQKFLDTYPDDAMAPQAGLGVAASLDAQGKSDAAISAYQKAISQTSDANVVSTAKFALARIDETQGKYADADKLYNEIARAYPGTSMNYEAGLRDAAMKAKALAATPSATAPASTTSATNAPFTLSH